MTTNNNNKIDLNTCKPGQRVQLRDGKTYVYEGVIDQNLIYPHAVDGYSYTSDGCFWDDDRVSSKDIVKIFPMEEEPVKTARELTHLITDQLDVTSPDHVSISPNENGVTISIKKGKTTINWRHSNN